MKYFYWHCKECGRSFRSYKSGGRNICCPCRKGSDFGLEEISKKDYDVYVKEILTHTVRTTLNLGEYEK